MIEKLWLKNRLDIMNDQIHGREMIQKMQVWQKNESAYFFFIQILIGDAEETRT